MTICLNLTDTSIFSVKRDIDFSGSTDSYIFAIPRGSALDMLRTYYRSLSPHVITSGTDYGAWTRNQCVARQISALTELIKAYYTPKRSDVRKKRIEVQIQYLVKKLDSILCMIISDKLQSVLES